jgi:hypothetical protein
MEEVKTEVVTEEEKKNKEPKTTKQKVIFGLKIAGNVVFYALIIALFLFSLMNIRGGNGRDNFANLFGSGILTIKTNSMDRDENSPDLPEWKDYKIGEITTADLIHASTYSSDMVDTDKIHVGDVIVFRDDKITDPETGTTGWLNCHRVVYIYDDKTTVITQGDKKAQTTAFDKEDPFGTYNGQLETNGSIETVSAKKIRGVVTSVNYGSGAFFKWIQSSWLFIVVIPIALLLAFEIFLVVKNILAYRKEKLGLADGAVSEEDKQRLLEEEKEKLRAELLAELQAQGLAPKAEENKPEEVKETESVENNEVIEEPQTEDIKEEVKVDEQKEEPAVQNEAVESNDSKDEVVEKTNEDITEEKASE